MKKELIILILFIFIISCTTKVAQNQTTQDNKTVEKDEFSELKSLVHNYGWDIVEEIDDKEIKKFKIFYKFDWAYCMN